MITIRRLQVGEADLFKQTRLKALKDEPYAFSSTYDAAVKRSPESWLEQAEYAAQGRDRAAFIAFYEEEPVGMAAPYRRENQPEDGELLQIWVSPAYRGTGAAWELLDAIFQWATEINFR